MNCAARTPKIPSNPLTFPDLKKGDKRRFSNGFTLVEVIVTILIAAIMGAFFIQFMGTAMSKSSRAIENVRDEAGAEALMEQIIADYVAEINKTDPTLALETIKGKIYGASVSMNYINFNSSGVEETLISPNKSNTLKVMVQAPGNNLTTLLTNSRVLAIPPDPILPPVEF
jgi:prepilin-type N-terminal cleavage/methylation domain-containing protein